MKKLITLLTVMVLLLGIGTTQVFAAEAGRRNFADRSGDSICDYQGQHCQNFADENEDGICDNHIPCTGRNYLDDNKDGICDNRSSRGCGNAPRHHGSGHRRGCR